jgi:hypothetical protein
LVLLALALGPRRRTEATGRTDALLDLENLRHSL